MMLHGVQRFCVWGQLFSFYQLIEFVMDRPCYIFPSERFVDFLVFVTQVKSIQK